MFRIVFKAQLEASKHRVGVVDGKITNIIHIYNSPRDLNEFHVLFCRVSSVLTV